MCCTPSFTATRCVDLISLFFKFSLSKLMFVCLICFSPSLSVSEGMTPVVGSYGSVPQPIPRFQHPSHELLQDNGFTQQRYHKYYNKCLKGLSLF